jgi:hypothetical protein
MRPKIEDKQRKCWFARQLLRPGKLNHKAGGISIGAKFLTKGDLELFDLMKRLVI